MKTRIAALVGPRRFEIEEADLPRLKRDEILLKVIANGVCHSEMDVFEGRQAGSVNRWGEPLDGVVLRDPRYPIYIGHEPSGIVEEVGSDVKAFRAGDRVTGSARPAFRQHLIFNEEWAKKKFVKIPDSMSLENVNGNPIMCVANIVRWANPELGDTVVVLGCGFMGLLTLCGLAHSGAREVVAVDLIDERLALAKKYGATRILNPKRDDVAAVVSDLTKGRGADVVVEITGRFKVLELAVRLIRERRAKLLIPSMYGTVEAADIGWEIMLKAPQIMATHPAYSDDNLEDLKRGVWAYEAGIFPMDELVTHKYTLEQTAQAFEDAKNCVPGFTKGVVLPWAE